LKLFVERSPVKLKPVEGEVHFFDYLDRHSGFRVPLMKDQKGEYAGFSSGVRGAIVQKKSNWFRIKGCGYGVDNVQMQPHLGTPEPEGGQLQDSADGELKVLKVVNQALGLYGIPNSVEPWGRFDYKDFKLFDDQCSASVYKIKGDTRADEFVLHLFEECLKKPEYFKDEIVNKNVCSLLENIGKYSCGVINAVHRSGISWNIAGTGGTNAHIGNLVIYEDESPYRIKVGITDFDGQTVDNINNSMKRLILKDDEKFEKDYFRIINNEFANLRGSVYQGIGASTISGAHLSIIPQPWLQAFDKGLVESMQGKISNKEFALPAPIDFNCDRVFRRLVETSLKPRNVSYGGFSRLYNDFNKNYGLNSIYKHGNFINSIEDYIGGRDIGIYNPKSMIYKRNMDIGIGYNRKNDYLDGIYSRLDDYACRNLI
jgi:hypothetical protein